MNCKKCGKKLSGKQTSFCSPRHSKQYAKNEWQKRNREKAAQYNREWRAKHSSLQAV